jgi:dihydrofolate synthase/folylpolyglutamate synthase
VNGEEISKSDLVALVEEMRPIVAQVPELTTFEITTALGFLYFARKGVQIAVVEVGLGGRLDATNVVDPLVSVITSLSYDHMNVLGNSLTEIAREKAGIINPGRPVVSSPQKDEARVVLEQVAAERGSSLFQVVKDFLYAPVTHSLDEQSLLVWAAADQPLVDDFIESGGRHDWEPLRLHIPLLGYHQVENAAVAYAALQVARQAGWEVSQDGILKGFSQVYWPGRFEVLRRNPPVVIDSAHNRDSALKLRLALDDYLPGQRVILVFGASEDKDIAGMFVELLPRVHRVIATQSIHPRAMSPAHLVELARPFGVPVQDTSTVEHALETAVQTAGEDALLLVTGSIFVVAGVREVWIRGMNKKGNG